MAVLQVRFGQRSALRSPDGCLILHSFNEWKYPKLAGWFLLGQLPSRKWMMTGGTPIYGAPRLDSDFIQTFNLWPVIPDFFRQVSDLSDSQAENGIILGKLWFASCCTVCYPGQAREVANSFDLCHLGAK